jgi:hypothetical protein
MSEPEPLEGHVDVADWRLIAGWAFNPAEPETPLWLECVIDDRPPVRFLANMLRGDLQREGVGTGRYGFHLSLPAPLDPTQPHQVTVRRESDGRILRNSPRLLERAKLCEPDAQAWFEGLMAAEIEAAAAAGDLMPPARLLLTQVDRLLLAEAELANGSRLRERFRRRWDDVLGGIPPAPTPDPQPDPRPWALVIDAEQPVAPEKLALIRALQASGHRVAAIASAILPDRGPEELTALGVVVHGAPLVFSVEDLLRREAGLYRCVVLFGFLAAAAYGLVARLHQPRARIVACLPGAPAFGPEDVMAVMAMLAADHIVVPGANSAEMLMRRVPGRPLHAVDLTQTDPAILRALAPAIGVRLEQDGP